MVARRVRRRREREPAGSVSDTGPSVSLLGLPSRSERQSNLITNESFETPVVTPGTFTDFPTGSALISGWTVVGPTSTAVAIVSGTFSQLGVSFPAQDR